AIVNDVFTGSAATGGFLGAGFAFAFNRGVNRGLFSNEAGQGSAPIAHAAARAHEPVSEGLVALLEPFIDTIIICMLTGLTLLASGVWSEKIENQFQDADMIVLNEYFSDTNPHDIEKLNLFLSSNNGAQVYNGEIEIENGEILNNNITLLHARSIAENVKVYNSDKQLFTGLVTVNKGKIERESNIVFTGQSLIHSAPLTTEAFSRSWFGNWGRYIVAIGLLLFAFSTSISWSYYGDRAVTYLFGIKYIVVYRIVYVAGFFFAAFIDTTLVWIFSGITIALMTVPNLIGILALRKEMKSEIKSFNDEWNSRFDTKKGSRL
ncbi:MAG TPA: alanine:cation symporter family protein, partial [Prolixibacteraceae bacterium]|nr:alanine:cation symporter family protein [Prolixibacteraceae bacterium]